MEKQSQDVEGVGSAAKPSTCFNHQSVLTNEGLNTNLMENLH